MWEDRMVGICLTQGTTAGCAGIHIDINGLPVVLLHQGHPVTAGHVPPKPLEVVTKFRVEGNVPSVWTLSEGSEHPI